MTIDPNEQLLRRVNRHTIILVVILCCILGFAGSAFLLHLKASVLSLRLSWMGEDLKVYSPKDGPFVVTHLFQPWSGTQECSVATLPVPVTIIDSRGHYFSREELHALTWIGASGRTNSPPPVGRHVKAFYWVPKETDRTSTDNTLSRKDPR